MIFVKLKFLAQPTNLQVLSFTLNLDTPLVRLYTGVFVTGTPLAGQIQIGANLSATLTNVKNYIDTTYGSPEISARIVGNDILIEPLANNFTLNTFSNITSVLEITQERTPMNLIFVRTPFFIEVDSASQVESKIELFIWHKGETEPTTPTYTLSKKAASTTQTKNIYNISNYVKEFIDIVRNQFMGGVIQEEEYNNWCYVKIKRYKATTIGSFTLLNTLNYVATNGYWDYQSGQSAVIGNTFISLNLFQQNKLYKYYDGTEEIYPYLSFFIDYTDDTDVYKARYTNFETIPTVSNQTILDGETEEIYLFTIPVRLSDTEFNDGCKLEILKNDVVIQTHIFKPECEPKYKPIRIDYINKYGGWGFITFFKAKTQTWEVKNKEYKLLPDDVNYNIFKGETQAFNYEAKQSIKLNTGWVDETYNELIKDLMVSETIMLYDYEAEDDYFALKPVKLKTMSTDLKSSLQDKMINYQMEFEYNYNQIQNVI